MWPRALAKRRAVAEAVTRMRRRRCPTGTTRSRWRYLSCLKGQFPGPLFWVLRPGCRTLIDAADGQRGVAEVSRRWVRVRDTYGVSVQRGVDVPLILAATLAIDAMRKD